MSDLSHEIEKRIRNYRTQLKISQEELDEKCSLHPTYIGQVERGEKNATIESISRIAVGLNIPLSTLFENLEGTVVSEKSCAGESYNLIVISQEKQYDMLHLPNARSICLDVLAVDSEEHRYNLEIQHADNGAAPKRARYHSSAMDIEFLKVGQDFDELPITYVIFITENYTMNRGEPICFIERINTATGKPFGDDEHIIFVNGAYHNAADGSDLAKLIHDFKATPHKA